VDINITKYQHFIKEPYRVELRGRRFLILPLTVRAFFKLLAGEFETTDKILKEFCPDALEEGEVFKAAILQIIIKKVLTPGEKKGTHAADNGSKKMNLNYSYVMAKFLKNFPGYTVGQVLDMEYEVFSELLEALEIVHAEEQKALLALIENQLLLKHKSTVDRHKELRRNLNRVADKGVSVREYGAAAVLNILGRGKK